VAEGLSALVVDDEPVARELLRSMLGDTGRVQIVGECRNVREAVEAIRLHAPDVVFLDVEMPDGTGFDVIEEVGVQGMPSVVFVTAYDHYALKAFEVVAADYLLKPFDEERLQRTVERLLARGRGGADAAEHRILALLEELRPGGSHADRLAVDAGTHMLFVPTSQIDWIEAKGKHVLVHAGAESYQMRDGLTSVAARLDPREFIRVHRSSVVRVDRIREVHRWFRGDYRLVLSDGTRLTTGSTYKQAIEQRLLGSQRPPG
jgi:two-component system, LytTR family, response regulator